MSETNVMQRAEKSLSFWDQGSMWARLIERDLNDNDLEALEFHLSEAESAQTEFENLEEYSKKFDLFALDGKTLEMALNWPILSKPEGVGDCES